MLRVTSIKPQKRKDRLNVFLDEKFAFGVGLQVLLSENIKVGSTLGEEQLKKILKKENFSKLYDSSLKILSARPRSEKEIKDYLAQKIAKTSNVKFSEAKESVLIAQIITKLKNQQFVDDFEFAKWWSTSRTRQLKGPRLIKVELIKKGIDRQIVDDISLSFKNTKGQAAKAVEKKLKIWRNLPKDKLREKVYRYLAQRGFDWETIKETFAFFEKSR